MPEVLEISTHSSQVSRRPTLLFPSAQRPGLFEALVDAFEKHFLDLISRRFGDVVRNLNNFLQILFAPIARYCVQGLRDNGPVKQQQANELRKISIDFYKLKDFTDFYLFESIDVMDNNKDRTIEFRHGGS